MTLSGQGEFDSAVLISLGWFPRAVGVGEADKVWCNVQAIANERYGWNSDDA